MSPLSCLLVGIAVAAEAFVAPGPCSLLSRRYLGPVTRQSQHARTLNVGNRLENDMMIELNVCSSEGEKAREAALERANKLQETRPARSNSTLLKRNVMNLVTSGQWAKVIMITLNTASW